jgi:hypothetical protein
MPCRSAAEHLRASPEWITSNWTDDSQSQFQKNLSDIHQGSDVVSVHFYNSDNERLGNTGHMNANFLNIINQAASSTNKPLYVGEFADVNPGNYNTTTNSEDLSAVFSRNVMQLIRSLNIPFSSPWVWERYWSAPIGFNKLLNALTHPLMSLLWLKPIAIFTTQHQSIKSPMSRRPPCSDFAG